MSSASLRAPSHQERWTLIGLGTFTLVFGCWGGWLYDATAHPAHAPDVASVFYHSCQLLIGHGAHLSEAVPWQLQLGRLLGLGTVFFLGVQGYVKFLLPQPRDHVVICGLGNLGLRLAREARWHKRNVVAIEHQSESAAIREAQDLGVSVIKGDASSVGALEKARIKDADIAVIVCSDDTTNRAIAAQIRQLIAAAKGRRKPLLCRQLVRESRPVGGLASTSGATDPENVKALQMITDPLDVVDVPARQALRQCALDFQPIRESDETVVHLVVAGFDAMGRALALHAAKIGHFANCTRPGKKLRITVAGPGASAAHLALVREYTEIGRICELDAHDASSDEALLKLLEQIARAATTRGELVTFALCFENEGVANNERNLRIGLPLVRLAHEHPVQVLAYQDSRLRYDLLVAKDADKLHASPRFHPFGMQEDIFTWDVLLRGKEDVVARALHEDYRMQQKRKRTPDANNPAWESLSPAFLDSNRQAGDHIAIKLRALGYHIAPVERSRPRIEGFSRDELELLAQMEHSRWCAERWLSGWKKTERDTDRSQKLSRALVDWKDLPPEEQAKDGEQAEAIVHVLYGAGLGIYR